MGPPILNRVKNETSLKLTVQCHPTEVISFFSNCRLYYAIQDCRFILSSSKKFSNKPFTNYLKNISHNVFLILNFKTLWDWSIQGLESTPPLQRNFLNYKSSQGLAIAALTGATFLKNEVSEEH